MRWACSEGLLPDLDFSGRSPSLCFALFAFSLLPGPELAALPHTALRAASQVAGPQHWLHPGGTLHCGEWLGLVMRNGPPVITYAPQLTTLG